MVTWPCGVCTAKPGTKAIMDLDKHHSVDAIIGPQSSRGKQI